MRKLWSLSIVPPNKVISVWEKFIKDSVPYIDEEQTEDSEDEAEAVTYKAALEQFMVYFESTWLGSKMLEIQRDQEGRPGLTWVFGTSMTKLSMKMTDVTTSTNRGTQ